MSAAAATAAIVSRRRPAVIPAVQTTSPTAAPTHAPRVRVSTSAIAASAAAPSQQTRRRPAAAASIRGSRRTKYPPSETGLPTVDPLRGMPAPPYQARITASPGNSGGKNAWATA